MGKKANEPYNAEELAMPAKVEPARKQNSREYAPLARCPPLDIGVGEEPKEESKR